MRGRRRRARTTGAQLILVHDLDVDLSLVGRQVVPLEVGHPSRSGRAEAAPPAPVGGEGTKGLGERLHVEGGDARPHLLVDQRAQTGDVERDHRGLYGQRLCGDHAEGLVAAGHGDQVGAG